MNRKIRLCFVGVLALLGSDARAFEGYSDPLRPSDAAEVVATPPVSLFGISARLKRVEQLIEKEGQALDALAPLQPAKQFDAFGYHSDYWQKTRRSALLE